MPNRLTAKLALLLSFTFFSFTSHAEVIKIGVYSNQDFRTTMKNWANTANYLKQQLPQHVFQILPYSRQADLVIDLEKNKLDFLLTKVHNLAPLMADFAFAPILNANKETSRWVLAQNQSLPYTITFSITDVLLKQSSKQHAKAGYTQWKLTSISDVQLSTGQKFRQLYNQFMVFIVEILNIYWAVFIAALLSVILILIHRQWDHYHRRMAEINKHRQQPSDPNLSDTVF